MWTSKKNKYKTIEMSVSSSMITVKYFQMNGNEKVRFNLLTCSTLIFHVESKKAVFKSCLREIMKSKLTVYTVYVFPGKSKAAVLRSGKILKF